MKKDMMCLFALFYFTFLYAKGDLKVLKLNSPSSIHEAIFRQVQVAPAVRELRYSVSYNGESALLDSRAGLQLGNRVLEKALGVRDLKLPNCWMDNWEIDSVGYFPLVDNT